MELREDFSFDLLKIASIAMMYDAYLAFAFDASRPEGKLEYRRELCPSSMVLPEALKLADEYRIDEIPPTTNDPKEWEYLAYVVPIPRGFSDKQDEFQVILDSSLLPKPIAALVEKYLDIVEDNITVIRDVIKECVKEMPAKYPELDDLKQASYNWIRSRINKEFKPLEPTAKTINERVRAYFDSDNLLPSKTDGGRILRTMRQLIKHG